MKELSLLSIFILDVIPKPDFHTVGIYFRNTVQFSIRECATDDFSRH